MKIFICSSKHFYNKVPPIKNELEQAGHIITLPNSYGNPMKEEEVKKNNPGEHSKWKGEMLRLQVKKIINNDAILVLNFDKSGNKNYVGGATFLEVFKAWELNKKIFFYNDLPDGSLRDELNAFNPTIVQGDLTKIR
ncbi:MAG: hypothetical protein AABW73_00360 [Nanoarchaeota archaeon]